MLFAVEKDGRRLKPTFSGQRATCELCGGILIGKCGEIYVHHWQHDRDRDCDPWKEHETPWHREWKALFPSECQEVVIENSGEKHRADVKTLQGTVIEFQHSSISTTTIRTREAFYGKMIWVIDAKPFSDNIYKRSVVKEQLGRLESERERHGRGSGSWGREIEKKYDGLLEENAEKQRYEGYDLTRAETGIKALETKLADMHAFTKEVIVGLGWGRDSYGIEFTLPQKFVMKYGEKIKGLNKDLQRHRNVIQEKTRQLDRITGFEILIINEIPYRIVGYEMIRPALMGLAAAVSKQSKNSIFPEVTQFDSQEHFLSFAYKKNLYDFILDLREIESNLKKEIEEATEEIKNCTESLSALEVLITPKLQSIIKGRIGQNRKKIDKSNERRRILERNRVEIYRRAIEAKTNADRMERESNEAMEVQYSKDRSEVMRTNKGFYRFSWKYERTSWMAAGAKTYFDFGDDYLYERTQSELFRRVAKTDFLSLHTATAPI